MAQMMRVEEAFLSREGKIQSCNLTFLGNGLVLHQSDLIMNYCWNGDAVQSHFFTITPCSNVVNQLPKGCSSVFLEIISFGQIGWFPIIRSSTGRKSEHCCWTISFLLKINKCTSWCLSLPRTQLLPIPVLLVLLFWWTPPLTSLCPRLDPLGF